MILETIIDAHEINPSTPANRVNMIRGNALLRVGKQVMAMILQHGPLFVSVHVLTYKTEKGFIDLRVIAIVSDQQQREFVKAKFAETIKAISNETPK